MAKIRGTMPGARRWLKALLRQFGLLDAVIRLRHLHSVQVRCPISHLGTEYGGWAICPALLPVNGIVYSFGIGEDASFDLDVIARFQARVFAFDPTPRCVAWVSSQEWPPTFAFHPWGLAASDGQRDFYPPEDSTHVSHSIIPKQVGGIDPIHVPMYQMDTLAKRLHHDHIDLLKMDIEGAEYEVIGTLASVKHLGITQILVEFHHFFPEVGIHQTREAVRQLNTAGYRIFHVSPSGHEYSFAKF